jgi:hypothetical protein
MISGRILGRSSSVSTRAQGPPPVVWEIFSSVFSLELPHVTGLVLFPMANVLKTTRLETASPRAVSILSSGKLFPSDMNATILFGLPVAFAARVAAVIAEE